MTPAEEIARFIADEGLGTLAGTSGWAVFYADMPERPDTAICCYDSGGPEPLDYDIELREPAVEVRVRGNDYAAVQQKFQAIFDLLVQPGGVPDTRTIGDGIYIDIGLDSDLISLGRDDNDRHRVSGNYRCNRQPVETSS